MDEIKELYRRMLNDIAKEKGGSPEQFKNLLGKIAFMESGGDPTIKQIGGGPGRGKYQFEGDATSGASNRIKYAAIRTKRYFKSKGQEVPEFVENIVTKGTADASKLTEAEQDILALGDLRMGPVNMYKFTKGELSDKEIYLNHWWAGKDQAHRQKLSSRWDERDNDFKKSNLYTPTSENQITNDDLLNLDPSINKKPNPFDQMKAPSSMVNDNMASSQLIKSSQMMKAPEGLDSYMNKKAQGGLLNEKFNQFNGGGTHEQNPIGGIPQGMGANGKPNTVEEDETSYDFPEGKFIFSNRIKI